MKKINQYITTYQKDYTWPDDVSSKCFQPPIKPIVVKDCTCTDSRQEYKELLDGKLEKYRDWSRMGPMGRLLEPKIYEIKIEQAPKREIMRLDRLTNICFKEAYPGLYETLEKPSRKEPMERRDIDFMYKTTYQKDYSDPAARMTQRDVALTVPDTTAKCPSCSIPKIIMKTDCSPYCSLSSSIYNGDASFGKRYHESKIRLKREKKCKDIRQMSLPSWKSEYQDSINKIGHAIMRVKLHHAKKKTLPIQYQYSTPCSRE
ncbi:PREDICTED: uncharacterized protein LOC108752131 isoform X2 [Trachymyrmex septentrionalis]|uniref:uncharacterized protein LOC108752131 isoform X2 n=1 Tax=Trachymyrmex septentrionalis TaxID=34720 RepID=UPI00084EFED5|nr:PREDICTED: uncharacterized protein LOC108752131 isoform X2 [Trachymyrmex septentrionalis]